VRVSTYQAASGTGPPMEEVDGRRRGWHKNEKSGHGETVACHEGEVRMGMSPAVCVTRACVPGRRGNAALAYSNQLRLSDAEWLRTLN
jgi:hypothetical protein